MRFGEKSYFFIYLYRKNAWPLFIDDIAPLIQVDDTDELAKRFDNFMHGMILE